MEPPDTTDTASRREARSREATPPPTPAQTEEAGEERPSSSAAPIPSTSSTTSRATSRSQDSTKQRRFSRRASLGPYPAQREGSPESSRRAGPSRTEVVPEEGEERSKEGERGHEEEIPMEEVAVQPEERTGPDLAKER